MIRTYHNHTPHTNPRHRKEEPQNTDCHQTSVSLTIKVIAKVDGHKILNSKTMTKQIIPINNGNNKKTINQQHST